MATPNSQNSATLTNNVTVPSSGTTPGQVGWDGSVCVISAFNTSSTSSAQGYQQGSLTLLQFSDGTNTVPAGQNKTLMLDQNIPGGDTPMSGYNLLLSQPNNLFPVAVVGELAGILSGDFPPITIPAPRRRTRARGSTPSYSCRTCRRSPVPTWLKRSPRR